MEKTFVSVNNHTTSSSNIVHIDIHHTANGDDDAEHQGGDGGDNHAEGDGDDGDGDLGYSCQVDYCATKKRKWFQLKLLSSSDVTHICNNLLLFYCKPGKEAMKPSQIIVSEAKSDKCNK